jgi:hypothetical protein
MMVIFESELKELAANGVEIFLAAINPEGYQFHPWQMTDESGIILDNIKPFRLSEFRNTYRYYI